ncbi:MAG: carbon-nitrogen hydrolase family protein [Firmicutes bacterium]|nr:carbon-nitrogen hydrolase family protein [Bacillota bacterium]
MKIKVAAIQMSAEIANHAANVERAKNLIRQAAEDGCRLCVLPELALDEFFVQWKDTKYFSYAEPPDGPTVRAFQELARQSGVYIALPHFEKAIMGNFYNSLVIIDDQGKICGVYRKNHIPFTRSFEKYYFTPGQGFPVFDTAFGKLGALICYDRRYPESCRELVKKGAQLVVIAISSMRFKGVSFSEIPTWEAELRTRALENQVFIIAANRSGAEGDYEFIGRSMIMAPDGEVLAKVGEEENVIVAAEIETDLVEETRRNLPLFRDRRPDLYSI